MRTWKANWCNTCGGGANFGDQLTPHLLRHHGIRFDWAKPAMANLFVVGSIASKIPRGARATIIGTGLIRADMRRDLTHAKVLSLRGPLTAERCGLDPKAITYGDAGILAGDLIPADMANVTEDTGTVIVPHYVDRHLWQHAKSAYKDPTPLAITEAPLKIIQTIRGARHVVTSSLHAFIAADVFGIPVTYQRHPDVIGDGFKFDDYASGIAGHHVTVTPGVPYLTDRNVLAERQEALRSQIRSIK